MHKINKKAPVSGAFLLILCINVVVWEVWKMWGNGHLQILLPHHQIIQINHIIFLAEPKKSILLHPH